EEAGYPVERNVGLGGTAVLMEAVFADQIDVFVEYTGTGLIAMLQQELPEIPEDSDTTMAEEVYRLTKEGYDQEYNLTWLEQMGWYNKYALGLTADFAGEHGLEKKSEQEQSGGDQ